MISVCPSPGDLSDPGIEPRSPALQAYSLPFGPTVIQVYAPTAIAKEAEIDGFYEELLEPTP